MERSRAASTNSATSRGNAYVKDVSQGSLQFLANEIVAHFNNISDTRKLEEMGYTIGYRFTQRFVQNNTRFTSNLDIIKFLCKDLWTEMFGKQIDKLQTNHKGVFVLHDNAFFWVNSLSFQNVNPDTADTTKQFLILPCGIIRGALASLGLDCTIRVESSALPLCFFNIQINDDSQR